MVTRKGTNHMGDQSCIEDIEVRHRPFKFCGRSAPLAGSRSCPGPSLECPPPVNGGGDVRRFSLSERPASWTHRQNFPHGCSHTTLTQYPSNMNKSWEFLWFRGILGFRTEHVPEHIYGESVVLMASHDPSRDVVGPWGSIPLDQSREPPWGLRRCPVCDLYPSLLHPWYERICF